MATFAQTSAGQSITGTAWPNTKKERITAPRSSDLIQTEAQLNALLGRLAAYLAVMAGEGPITTTTPVIGTTNTITVPASVINITGTPITVAADTNKAIAFSGGTTGTIKALLWGLFTIERVAAGTTTFVGASGNSTGFATEALAIAAMPAITASKARVAYVTLVAGASDWTPGTDGLAGGSGGTVATTTNYYGVYGTSDTNFWSNSAIANLAGTIVTSANSY